MRVVRFGFDTPGFRLRRDAWHRAAMGIVLVYIGWQSLAGLLGFVALIDRGLSGTCRLGAACEWFPANQTLLFIVAIALASATVSVVQLLRRLLRGLRQRQVWAGLAGRVVGIVTAVIGVFGLVVGVGLPWIVLGLLLAIAAQRMSVDNPLGQAHASGPNQRGPGPGAVPPPERDDVRDVPFRDK